MKIVVITQEDAFVIPKNVERLLTMDGVTVAAIRSIEGKGSFGNKRGLFVKGFGLRQSAKMAARMTVSKCYDIVDRLSGGRLPGTKASIRSVALKYGVPYRKVGKLNCEEFYEELRAEQPDLVVSFSAPVVFSPELLAIPKQGCINLHCSLLPHYAGILPSFWTLYHGEKETGTTVHFMDDKIDNGGILGQCRIDIADCPSMFRVIRKTKDIGGQLMVEVIGRLQAGTAEPRPNDVSRGSYFTWPTVEQLREFRKRGGRLI